MYSELMRWLFALAACGLSSLGLAFTPGRMEFSDWALPDESAELQPSIIRKILDEPIRALEVPSEWEFSYSVSGTLTGFDERSEAPVGGGFSFASSPQPIRLKAFPSEGSLDVKGIYAIEGRWKGYGAAPERAVVRIESLVQHSHLAPGQIIGGCDLHLPWHRFDGGVESAGTVQTQVWTRPDGSFRIPIEFHYRLKHGGEEDLSRKEFSVFFKALAGDDSLVLILPEGLMKKPSEMKPEGEIVIRPAASLSSTKEVSLSLTRDASLFADPSWIGQFEFLVGTSDPTSQYRATVLSTEGVEAIVDPGPTSNVKVKIRIPEAEYLAEMKEKGEVVRYLLVTLTPNNEKLFGHLVIRCRPPVSFSKVGAVRKVYQDTANRRLWKRTSASMVIREGQGLMTFTQDQEQLTASKAQLASIRASFPTPGQEVVWRETSSGKLAGDKVKLGGALSNPLSSPIFTHIATTLACREQMMRAVVYGPKGLVSDRLIAYREFSPPCPHLPGLKDQEGAYCYVLEKGKGDQSPTIKPAFGPFPFFTKGSEHLKDMVRVYERIR